MGKKGSWFSAIKRVFTHSSKEKPTDGPDKKSGKENKKGKGILRHGETRSFIPLFGEPSSIEKILGEADQLLIRHPTSSEQTKHPPALPVKPISPRIASPNGTSHRASSPTANSERVSSPKAVYERVSSPKATSERVSSPKATSERVSSPKAASQMVSSLKASCQRGSPKTASQGVCSPRVASPKAPSPMAVSPRVASPKARPLKAFATEAASYKVAAPKVTQSRKEISYVQRPEPTLRYRHLSATKIQAAYRGYLARRSFRALRGLVRLQGVVRGQNVKRQTMNAMKQMQLLVRVQTQIQLRRIQMLENQALQHQAYRNDKEVESTLSKWTLNQTEAGQSEDWDDSLLTKEGVEARLREKVEAFMKRERAMAYAYSHQLWKANPKSAQKSLEVRSNGFPWWWNLLERQLPQAGSSQNQAAMKSIMLTPPRPISEYKRSLLHPSNYKQSNFTSDNQESVMPRSSTSPIPVRAKHFQTPRRTPPASSCNTKYSKPGARAANSACDAPLKDDDSLVSCPPFSAPNYMTPTVSAKAKARANSNPRERLPGTPSNDSKRRFSFPLTPNIGSFKWNKGSNKDSASQMGLEKREDLNSIGDFSVGSAISMPTLVGRKPFNRFV